MIQPFKNLTIVMAHKTNAGMTDGSHVAETTEGGTASTSTTPKVGDLNIEAFRVKGDLRYTPVVLNADGFGYALAQDEAIHKGGSTVPKGAVIGILMESFDKPMHEHEVMIHGVVGMKCKGAIHPGAPVYWSETDKAVSGTVSTSQGKGVYYLGLSLTKTTDDGQFVDVLIGK